MEITRGVINGPQKICVYGPEGIGKSTFASKFPEPVFIDVEGSTRNMDVNRTPKPSSWTMLLEQIRYFKANPHLCKTLVIDTADWAEILCINELCAKYQKSGIEEFGYGKGYVYLAEEFGRLLNMLGELIEVGITVVFTAHAQMRKFEQPDEMGAYDRWEMKLQKKTLPLLKEWADMVLFANYKIYVVNVDGQGAAKGKNKVQGGKRIMYTSHHPCWDAKNRHNLEPELDFDYKAIAHCITTGAPVNPPKGTAERQQAAGNTTPVNPPVNPPVTPQKQETSNPPAPPATQPNTSMTEPPKRPAENLSKIPKPLADLMTANNVTIKDIQQAVGKRGYYPADTPIENYDPKFIEGVLVGAWPQVLQIIKSLKEEKPF